ncbi:hypothetical protein [Polaromonas sp. YR568]|uniref:hypothetical protein n=1 Tax=Polaromonas sp. YR568 TaxID=1855301 RepID=UPI000B8777DB|nr:hypothetical protein [Polaromonas sp. YR568]
MFMHIAAGLVLTLTATTGVVMAQPAELLQSFESCYAVSTGPADATGAISPRSETQKQQLIECLGKMPDSDPRKAYLLSQERTVPPVCDAAKSTYLPALEACGVELASAQNYREAHATLRAAVIAGSAFALAILLEESMDEDGFGAAIPPADKAFYAYVFCSTGSGLQVNQPPEVLYVPSLRVRSAAQIPSSPVTRNQAACAGDVDRGAGAKLTVQQRKDVRGRAVATVASFPVKARAFLAQYPEYRPFNATYR